MLLLPERQAREDWEHPPKKECSSGKRGDLIRNVFPSVSVVTINLEKVCFAKYGVKIFVQLL
jgi:hypothetical protein